MADTIIERAVPARSPTRWGLSICMILSLLFLGFAVIQDFVFWELNYWYDLGPFGLMAFTWPITIGFLLWLALSLILALFQRTSWRWLGALPFAISLAAPIVLMVFSSNDASTWLHYNYWRYGHDRKEVFDRLNRGEQFPRGASYAGEETIVLPVSPMLSIANTEPWIKKTSSGTMIYFHTNHGVPDGIQGFVYAPDGTDPKKEWSGLDAVEQVQFGRGPRVFLIQVDA